MTNEEAAAMLERMKNYFLPTSPMLEERREITALDLAISALSKQSASSEQADHIAESDKMVDQFREATKKTDSERVSPFEQEKSNSFSKEPSEDGNSEMNCSDVPDIRVGKTDFKPGGNPGNLGGNPGIILCKDCQYRDPEDKKCDHGHGIVWQLPRPDDWFCADGKA